MGLYFEDFQEGQSFVTLAKTITESDVMQFAGLSMDFNSLHTDIEFAKGTPYGKPIAHGLLGMIISSGLTSRTSVFDGTAIGVVGIKEWKFVAPIFFGETVHVEFTIVEKRKTSKPGRGIITREVKLIKQDGTMVQQGIVSVMVRCKEMEKRE